jgi:hypothetical protein
MRQPTHRKTRSERFRSFHNLLNLGADGIEEFRKAVASTGPSLMPPGRRALLVCKAINNLDLIDQVEDILEDVVFPANDECRKSRMSAEDYYSLLSEFIQNEDDTYWPKKYKEKWIQFREPLLALFKDARLSREAKARFLLEARPNRVRKLRLFTEVRPVFDDEDVTLHFDVVTNTLGVDYKSNNEIHTMYFSLDADDLEYLERQIARARQKNDIIKSTYGGPDKPTLLVEEPNRKTSESEG